MRQWTGLIAAVFLLPCAGCMAPHYNARASGFPPAAATNDGKTMVPEAAVMTGSAPGMMTGSRGHTSSPYYSNPGGKPRLIHTSEGDFTQEQIDAELKAKEGQ